MRVSELYEFVQNKLCVKNFQGNFYVSQMNKLNI